MNHGKTPENTTGRETVLVASIGEITSPSQALSYTAMNSAVAPSGARTSGDAPNCSSISTKST